DLEGGSDRDSDLEDVADSFDWQRAAAGAERFDFNARPRIENNSASLGDRAARRIERQENPLTLCIHAFLTHQRREVSRESLRSWIQELKRLDVSRCFEHEFSGIVSERRRSDRRCAPAIEDQAYQASH